MISLALCVRGTQQLIHIAALQVSPAAWGAPTHLLGTAARCKRMRQEPPWLLSNASGLSQLK